MQLLASKDKEVKAYRASFLCKQSCVVTLVQFFLLIMLTSIGVTSSAGWEISNRWLVTKAGELTSHNMPTHILPQFEDIEDGESFWQFMEG